MKYAAFISYSRTASGGLAKALQSDLQRFAKKWHQMRSVEAFRDDSNLSANPALWPSIVDALGQSTWFILLASPAAAASQYVEDEVRWWVEHRGPETVLIAHCGGTIAWSREHGRFAQVTDCLPPSLLAASVVEPRWIDLTWFDQTETNAEKDPRFAERVADLSCTIQGKERSQLVGEDVRQHAVLRRLRNGAIVALSVLLATSVAGGALAIVQGNEARSQRDLAIARQLSATARLRVADELQQALLLADTGHRTVDDEQTRSALYEVGAATPQLVGFVDVGGRAQLADATPDGRVVVAATESGDIVRIDRSDSTRTHIADFPGTPAFVAISDDGRTIAATWHDANFGAEAGLWVDGIRTVTESVPIHALSPDGRLYLKGATGLGNAVVEVVGGPVRKTDALSYLQPTWATLSNDGAMAAVNEYGLYVRIRPDGTEQAGRLPMGTWMFGGGVSGNGLRFTYTNGAQDVEVWDITKPSSDLALNEATLRGWSPTGEITGIALDQTGTRLVTARDGSLYVSAVTAGGGANAGTVLRGAGVAPHSLAFVGNDLLISVSGETVAVWDLARTKTGDQLSVELDPPCSACGPHDVAVSPSGTQAVITHPGYVFVDFEAGTALTGNPRTEIMASLWVDDDAFLAFAPSGGAVLVVGADQQVRRQIPMTPQSSAMAVSAVRRADGAVVALTFGSDGTSLVLIPPTLDSVESQPIDAQFLSADGRYVVRVTGDPQQVEFLSSEDLSLTGVAHLAPGDELLKVGPSDGATIPLIVAARSGAVRIDMHSTADWTSRASRSIGRVGEDARGGFKEQETDFTAEHLVMAEGTRVVRYHLGTGVRTELGEIGHEVRIMRGLRTSADGSALMVADVADGGVLRVALSSEEWSRKACLRAGRPGAPADLMGAGIESQGLVPGCS